MSVNSRGGEYKKRKTFNYLNCIFVHVIANYGDKFIIKLLSLKKICLRFLTIQRFPFFLQFLMN